MGGGGYGDPIDRDPEAVLTDVRNGLVSAGAALDIYGVALKGEAASVDAEGTRRRRLEVRSERAGREVDPGLSGRRDIAPSGMRLSEYLQRAVDGSTECTWCGDAFAPPGADWKEHAVLHRSPVSKAGSLRTSDGEYSLIEACCPACGTLLDTDLARYDDPPLHDSVERWPEAAA
jgi:N-methylhydantoinase B